MLRTEERELKVHVGESEAELANGTIEKINIVGPLIVNFKNRTTSCNAMVLPGESEVLLGAWGI